MSSITKFPKYNIEAASDAREEMQAEDDLRKPYYTLPVGATKLHILPPLNGQTHPWVAVSTHFAKFGQKTITIVCPRVHAKRACHVCTHIGKLAASHSSVDQDTAKELNATVGFFVNAQIIGKEEFGSKEVRLPKGVIEQLADIASPDLGNCDYTDVQAGRVLIIVKTGSGMETKYTLTMRNEPHALAKTDEDIEAILATATDLTAKCVPMADQDILDRLAGREVRRGGSTAVSAAARPAMSAPHKTPRLLDE